MGRAAGGPPKPPTPPNQKQFWVPHPSPLYCRVSRHLSRGRVGDHNGQTCSCLRFRPFLRAPIQCPPSANPSECLKPVSQPRRVLVWGRRPPSARPSTACPSDRCPSLGPPRSQSSKAGGPPKPRLPTKNNSGCPILPLYVVESRGTFLGEGWEATKASPAFAFAFARPQRSI